HHGPAEGCDADLRELLLEIGRSCAGAGPQPGYALARGRTALSCRRARSSRHRRVGQGGMLSIQRDFEASHCLSAIEADRLDAAWLAPVMTTSMLTCADRERYDVSSLRWAIGGGEKTPEVRIRAFSRYFTNARYIDAYGLTETVGGDTFMEPGLEIAKIGSTGRPVAHVEI